MKAVVAFLSFHENDLKQEIVDINIENWKEALLKHSYFNEYDNLDWLPDNYKEAISEAFDSDITFAVTFLKDI